MAKKKNPEQEAPPVEEQEPNAPEDQEEGRKKTAGGFKLGYLLKTLPKYGIKVTEQF